MTKRVFSLVLAIVMLLQILVPQTIIAKEEVKSPSDKQVQIGLINGNSYDSKLMQELNRLTAKSRRKRAAEPGISLFGYFEDGQEPKDEDKLKYHGEVKADLTVRGIDGNPFQWKDVFGTEELHLRFIQINDAADVETGTERVLNINKAGKYTWTDGEGNPAELPLFNNKLEPLTYEVKLDEEVSDKVKLLTARLTTTGNAGSPTFEKPDAEGRIKYHLTLEIGLQQVASSKFISEWHTAVEESARPQIQGTMTGSMDVNGRPKNKTIDFKFPTNNNDNVVVRTNSRHDKNKLLTELLYKTPTTDIKTDTAGLTFDTANKTVKSDKYKYKYDFNYDVINGGKLTMTEILPVTFDANGGKFANFTAPDTETKIVKEVEYDKNLTDKAEEPTKDGVSFKGWSTTQDGKTPVTDADFKNIKEAKTFYAIYDKASANISYLDLNGKSIDDKFKFDGAEYPKIEEGKAGTVVDKTKYTAETAPKFIGYKFNRVELNPKDAKYAFENQATIKIYYEKLDDIIQDKTPNDASDKPEGYVTVTFKPGDNGTIDGKTDNVVYYVNPKAEKKNSDLTEPTIKANTGFKVADQKWKPDFVVDTVITTDTTYTAQYTDGQDVIPVPDPENPPKKPEGYVTVKFDLDGKGTTNDVKEFYVNPNKEVEITAPTVTGINNYKQKTGDNAWNPTFSTKATYSKDKNFVAQYDFIQNVVPQKPGEDKPVVPKNYVKVEFKKGEHGLISSEETTIYWVNPDEEVTLTAPTVTANVDYKHTNWDKALKATFATATEITAQYKKKVVDTEEPKKPGTQDPDTDYVKVDFVAKDHGKIKDGEKATYWVLKDETVELKTPEVEPNEKYSFEKWDQAVQSSYKVDTTHKAVFKYHGNNVVPQKPGENKPDVPSDFVEVVFTQGDHGTIATDVTTSYWVKPNVKVTVTAPAVTANEGWKHVAWTYKLKATDTSDKEVKTLESVTDTFTEKKTTITAKYLNKVVEEEPQTDRDAYVKVTFKSETNGKLPENKTEKSYWVLKDTPVSLTAPSVTANPDYKFISYDTAVKTSYNEDTEHKAQYKEIIVKTDPRDKDYVKVTFDPGKQGSIKAGSNAEVWVLKGETIDKTKITPEIEVKDKNYAFKEWTPAVQTSYSIDTKHTATYTYNGDNVVPQKPGEDKPNVPEDFVKVTFVAGDHGSIVNNETYIYWVKANTSVTLNAPTVKAEKDYKHVAWTYKLKATDTDVKTTSGDNATTTVTDTFTEKETTITAKYLEKVVTTDPSDTVNYVKVDFKADVDGQTTPRGSLEGTTIYWVLKNVDVKVTAPKVTSNSGYTFAEWNPAVKTSYDANTTHTAQYSLKDKVVTQDPKDKDYIKITFDANGGKIGVDDKKDLWVLKGIASFADAKAKVANPTKEKATFKEWQTAATDGAKVADDKILSKDNETFYATWTNKGKIIEVTDPSVVPDPEYVRLTFDATDKGRIGDANGKQTKVIDVLKGTPYTDKDLLNVIAKIKAIPVKVSNGSLIEDANKTFDKWNPDIPKTGNVAEQTFTASYNDVDNAFTVKKVWEDDVDVVPTMNFTLYRKVTGSTEDPVKVDGAEVKEITKDNTTATWDNLAKTDSTGKAYEYSVKESFKDTDVKNDNWILGTMVTDANGNNKITNKLKTVPGTGDIPNENEHRMGKLTITKKIESKVVEAKMSRSMFRSAATPLEFTFKVTDPYGKEETFTLKAGESKELKNLLYGEYTVEETDAKGLTPFVKVGDGSETESKLGKVTLTKDAKEGTVTFTNKNVKPGINPNITEVKASKVWVNGPSTDHTAIDLKLYRQVEDELKEEVTDVTPVKTRDLSGDANFNYVWKDLPKINDDGKEYTYSVVEAGVTNNEVKVGENTYKVTQEGNTITNTYVVPKTDDLVATKQWVGVPAETETPKVKFQLQRTANGVTKDVGQAMALTNDQVNFGKQDKTDANGNVYVYSVKELDAQGNAFNHPNYTSEVNGLNVKNTYHAPQVKCTVTYKPGSASASGLMNPVIVAENTNYTVLANGFTNPGYTFKGWKVDNGPKIIEAGSTIIVKADVTLTAQWEKITTPPTPGDQDNPDRPNPECPGGSDYPYYPGGPIPMYPEVRYETIIQEKIVKVPVPVSDNYFKEVRYMQGFNGYFRPNDGLTRAEAAQILANALVEDGYKYNPNFKISYKDVGEAWYTRAVKIVTEANVFAGYDDGNFKPQAKITRNEWIATLKRFQELGDASGNNMNLRDDHWAKGEIQAAFNEGWLKIYTDGLATYKGDEFIPRQEVAAVSNKVFKRIVDKTYIGKNNLSLVTYKDVNTSMWAYEDILCASNTFLDRKDRYIAHWVKEDKNQFNIDTSDLKIVQKNFQRNPR